MQHTTTDHSSRVLGGDQGLDHQASQGAQGGGPHQHPVLYTRQPGDCSLNISISFVYITFIDIVTAIFAIFVIFIVIVIIIIFFGPALPLRLTEYHTFDRHALKSGTYSGFGCAVSLCSSDVLQCVDGAAAAAFCFVI